MQRWFYLEDKNVSKTKFQPKKPPPPEPKPVIIMTNWQFSVSAVSVGVREIVCITGNIEQLGEWDHTRVVPMEREPDSAVWSKTVTLPNTVEIEYRYLICTLHEEETFVVQRFESSMKPRIIKLTDLHPETDTFGEYDGSIKISRGWLTATNLLQFQFMCNPLKLKSHLSNRVFTIKVTPVKLNLPDDGPQLGDDLSLSTDTLETDAIPTGVSVEVSTLDDDPQLCILKPQEQFGREYRMNDVLIINVVAPKIEELAYLVDFYSYSTRAAMDDPPYHVGYTYVLPNMFKQSEGKLELPVTCNTKHRPLGFINILYLIVKPMEERLCDLKVSYAKHWDPSWTGLEVGHRGLGASFKNKEGNSIRENTIASLKRAAASGADLLEFDVQLSKDMIPVIYHDFHVCISMKRKREVDYAEMLELPVKDLTLEHLQKLKVYHLTEGRSHASAFNDDDLDEHQPFPTLEHTLKNIDEHVGFNVELKWTMELEDGTFELNNPFEMNTYVDKVLEVVLKHAGHRRIVFSCFNPDICTMVRYKQNKYPVMFLTVGQTERYPPYRDARCPSIRAAVQHAVSADILGVVLHTEDLLRDPTQMKLATDAGLVIFCWGDDNNDSGTIKKLKEMGLHAVIYDKLDKYSTKEVKESIFLVGARESQCEIIRLAALEDIASGPSSSDNVTEEEQTEEPLTNPPFLHLSVREKVNNVSTATSLESITSSVNLIEEPRQLKRTSNLISAIDKELQLKEERRQFCGAVPSGDTPKSRKQE